MRIPVGLFACAAAAIVGAWAWLGAPVEMPQSPLGPDGKLYCLSYAPFRADQSPLVAGTHIEAWQIDEDLGRLKRITNCIRTYSTEHGLDQVPEIARRHGITVLQGLWLSSHADKNRVQIDSTVELAKRFPDVIKAVIVGNEVLLRGELSATALGNIIREVKGKAGVPVTYADVWEFWLKNRDLASLVDFVTVHILPYWEDFPIPAATAAAHVDDIRHKVVQIFVGKELLIGEAGWPSAGRMREGALPSPSSQARVLHDTLAAARRGNYNVNLIEAFDQPWKRRLEGTVGGHWGLFTPGASEPKFVWGQPVSDHPLWRWQAGGGVAFAALIFVVAGVGARRVNVAPSAAIWCGVATMAGVAGVNVGLMIEKLPLESLGLGGWARGLALAGTALLAPLVGAAALVLGLAVPTFARVLGRGAERPQGLVLAVGGVLVIVTLLALQSALGLVFDPRYRDFPNAALSIAIVPFAVLALLRSPTQAAREAAETVAAATLVLSVLYIVPNEGFANWQALWFAALLAVLALTLLRSRDAQST